MRLTRLLSLALIVGFTLPAAANVVWPALYLETRLFSWYAIAGGLVAEYIVLVAVFRLSLTHAAGADIAMNLASALLGMLFLPLAGIAWEVFPGLLLYHAFNIGTFNPGTWVATVLMAAGINALIEAGVLWRFFHVPFCRCTLLWLSLANLVSVGIAMASLWRLPPES